MMRKIVFLCAAWFCVASAHAAGFPDPKPRPGSAATLNALVDSYRLTIVRLLELDAAVGRDVSGDIYREQVLDSVFVGLDNIDNNAANQLVIDLSTVYFGESDGPFYSCLVQRKAKKLTRYIKNGHSLSSNWCIEKLPDKFCVKDKPAPIGRLLGAIGNAGDPECGLSLY